MHWTRLGDLGERVPGVETPLLGVFSSFPRIQKTGVGTPEGLWSHGSETKKDPGKEVEDGM